MSVPGKKLKVINKKLMLNPETITRLTERDMSMGKAGSATAIDPACYTPGGGSMCNTACPACDPPELIGETK